MLSRYISTTNKHTPCMLQQITDLHMCVFVCVFRWTAFSKPCVCCPVSVPTVSALGGGG